MNIEHILHGDMPGDKIAIEQHHIEKAQRIYTLLKLLHYWQECFVKRECRLMS